jgi:N-acetylglucosamine kinase-like BadF-type ATPase
VNRYYIGVDGGATRTRAVVVDVDGEELARAEGAAASVDARHPERAAAVVEDVVRDVAREAGVALPCAGLWAGLAGTGRETARSGVEQALSPRGLATRVGVGTDVDAAFEDAFGGGVGILICSGTGSVAVGRSEGGQVARVGGWGSLLGDEGSGYQIGLESLRRVARHVDGRGAETRLQEAVLGAIGLMEVEELVIWAHDATKGDIAGLVPVVARSALAGDAVAREILDQAVEELEGHLVTLLENLGPWRERPPLALAGGLLDPGGPLREGMEAVVRRHHVTPVARRLHPARGAARRARAFA